MGDPTVDAPAEVTTPIVAAGKPQKIYQSVLTNEMGTETLLIPKGAEFLRLDDRYSQIYMWFLADPDAVMQERRFRKYGLEASVVMGGVYRGTAMLNGRSMHVFEEVS